MFGSKENKEPQEQVKTSSAKTVTMNIRDEDLHVMPKQYLPAVAKVKKSKNSNRLFFFVLGGLALVLALVIAGLLVYLRLQAPAQTLEVNVNSSVNDRLPEPEEQTPQDSATTRDLQRIKDINSLQTALRLYFRDFGSYPQVLAGIPSQYLVEEPVDPVSNQRYAYQPTNDSTSYIITFTVEEGSIYNNTRLTSGQYQVGPNGLITEDQPEVIDDTPVGTDTPPPTEQPDLSSTDGDQDGLTAAEEDSFGTNPNSADTDGDGFNDAEEILNLYSPLAGSGAQLDVSGLVRPYIDSNFNYSVWYPQDWIVRSLSAENREIIFSSPAGDSIAIEVRPNDANTDIRTWFAAVNPSTPLSSLRSISIGGFDGIRTADGLGIYFTDGANIFSLEYDVTGQAVLYPTVLELILKTFTFAI